VYQPRVLRQARSKLAIASAGSLIFVAIGLWLATSDGLGSSRYPPEISKLAGWACVAVFGWFVVLGLKSMIRPAELHLSSDGFRVVGLQNKPLVPWADVERFYLFRVQKSDSVVYDLRDEAKTGPQKMAALRTRTFDYDGTIPPSLELGAKPLMELLEDWRSRFGRCG
jgi:hypothetical protein